MKLLDPFAGYRLASGHPFFHIALFVGSWFILIFGDKDDAFVSSAPIFEAFAMLRWAHFFLFALSMAEAWMNRPSPIPPTIDEEDDDGLAKHRIMHRDGSYKLLSRIFACIAVFVYQGTVFYAQMVLADTLVDCTASTCTMRKFEGNRELWLFIEAVCFYSYMFATVAYIFGMMCIGTWERATPKSDMTKAVTDFVNYASINLTWFSFNFVLCAMPPVCMYILNNDNLVLFEN